MPAKMWKCEQNSALAQWYDHMESNLQFAKQTNREQWQQVFDAESNAFSPHLMEGHVKL
jgi:hypothetical protein